MSPPLTQTKITLSCPLYSSDFDPANNDFLLVGGGGGEGRSGVGNKITLLDVSKRDEISQVVEIDLSREEDSVTSLRYLQTTEAAAVVLAGINSSEKEHAAGRNDHLRSFQIPYPRRKSTSKPDQLSQSSVEQQSRALGKASLFTCTPQPKPETYQRVLKLAKSDRARLSKLGVVATGLASEGEIVLFNASTNVPSAQNVCARIKLGKSQEAADIDLLHRASFLDEKSDDDSFVVAYCKDYDVNLTTCTARNHPTNTPRPDCIYNIPQQPGKPRAKFRCLRLLTPDLLLLVQNRPQGKGSELILLETSGMILLRKVLHKTIKSATGLAIKALPIAAASFPSNETRVQQAIAVAGADNSITLLTLEHGQTGPYTDLTFKKHAFFPSVHPTSITSLSLASSSISPSASATSKSPRPCLRLASTSIANTVVVQTFPLIPFSSASKGRQTSSLLHAPLSSRHSSGAMQTIISVLIALLAISLGAFFLQAFAEIRGASPEVLGSKDWLNDRWHEWIARPYMFDERSGKSTPTIEVVPLPTSTLSSTPKPDTPTPISLVQKLRDHQKRVERRLAASTDDAPPLPDSRQTIEIPSSASDPAPGSSRNVEIDTDSGADDHAHILIQPHFDETSPEHSGSPRELKVLPHTPGMDNAANAPKKWEHLSEAEQAHWRKWLVEAGDWAVEEGETVLKGVFFSGVAHLVGAAVA